MHANHCHGLIFSLSFPPPFNTDNHSHKNKKVGSQVYAGVATLKPNPRLRPRLWPHTSYPPPPSFNTIVHSRKNKKLAHSVLPLARLKFDVCNSGGEKGTLNLLQCIYKTL